MTKFFYLRVLSSIQQIYLWFVIVNDDIEVRVWSQDRVVFHAVTNVMGTSSKANSDVDAYLVSQCCIILYFCSFIPFSDKNRTNLLPSTIKMLVFTGWTYFVINVALITVEVAKKGVKLYFKHFLQGNIH